MYGVEGLREEVESARSRMEFSPSSGDGASLPEYPRVTFLGTGSSVPEKYRNVSCVLVEVERGVFIMLDCGEGGRVHPRLLKS